MAEFKGPVAVKIEEVQNHAGVSFVNCQLMGAVDFGIENR